VDRVARRRRVLDADVALKIAAGEEPAPGAVRAVQLEARIQRAERAGRQTDVAAVAFVRARFRRDVDDAGGAVAVLRGEGAGQEREAVYDARIERLPEAADALRNDDAVETILQIGMIA